MKKISVLFLLSFISMSAYSCEPLVIDSTGEINNSSISASPSPTTGDESTSPAPVQGIQATVSTFAGSKEGFADGTGTNAMFKNPDGLAIDKNNNLYVADSFNNRVRKITPAGVVTTIAGDGTRDFKDGPALEAQFAAITGIAIDANENIAVSDPINHRIRKISPGGMVTTIAGDGEIGFSDGNASAARFSSPQGLFYDKTGNLYVADKEAQVIRLIRSNGIVSTVAGVGGSNGFIEGNIASGKFYEPYAITMDNKGDIYVADSANRRIRKISGGQISTIAGKDSALDANGKGTEASFGNPHSILSDNSGNIYFAANDRVKKLTPDGLVITVAGRGNINPVTDGDSLQATFYNPKGLVLDSNGNLFVADSTHHLIRKITFK